jgi:hypothetical protein
LNSEWGYGHRHWLEKISFFGLYTLKVFHPVLTPASLAPASTMRESMHKIKKISAYMLEQKIAAESQLENVDAKKDVVHLLMGARVADVARNKVAL